MQMHLAMFWTEAKFSQSQLFNIIASEQKGGGVDIIWSFGNQCLGPC